MMCECCYRDKCAREYASPSTRVDLSDVEKDHEARNCLCVMQTEAGARRRAGDYWDEEKKRDSRDDDRELSAVGGDPS